MIKKIREQQQKRIIEIARIKNASRMFCLMEQRCLFKNSWTPVYAFEILPKERIIKINNASS
jgi:hypothetical protein